MQRLFLLFLLCFSIFVSAQEDLKSLSLDDLMKHLDRTDTDEILDALNEIGERGAEAFTIASRLFSLLNHEEEWVRLASADILFKFGPAVLELFPQTFSGKTEQEKILLYRILGDLATAPEKVFPWIQQGFKDPSIPVQMASIRAAWQFQEMAEPLLPEILSLLNSGPIDIQQEAILALGEINPNRLEVLEALMRCTSIQDENLRLVLGEAISKVSMKAKEHLPLLLKTLGGCDSKYLKAKLLEAIGNVIDAQALESILEYIQDENYLIRYQALKSIQKIGILSPEQFKRLIPLFQDPYELIRILIPQVMAELQITESVPYLLTMLNDINVRVRMSVVRALGKIKPASPKQIRGLLKALQDVQMPIVEEAVVSFGNLGSEALPASETLMRFASVAKGEMLLALLKSLAKIKPPVEKWEPLLTKILENAEPIHCIWGYYALYETCVDKRSEAQKALFQYLNGEDEALRLQALEALTQMNPRSESGIEWMFQKYPQLKPHEQALIKQYFISLKIESRLEVYGSSESSEKK